MTAYRLVISRDCIFVASMPALGGILTNKIKTLKHVCFKEQSAVNWKPGQ